jgi:rhamnosyltransferase
VTVCSTNQIPAPQKHAREVCAVFVTHHPDAEFSAALNRVSPQVSSVVIVDNGSTDAELRMVRDLITDATVELIVNAENLGIARALNIGIQRAAALGYAQVLLMDQDSQVAPDMVASLLGLYASFPDRERLAVIGANFFDASGRFPEVANPGLHDGQWEEVESVITSGSLLPMCAYSIVGPFRDEFFIDYVDTDYCLRARAKGYRVIKSKKQLMSHALGSPTLHEWLWLKKWTNNHSADRQYYIARNDTVMLRESEKYRAGRWVLKSVSRRLKRCKRIALYEQMKAGKIIAVIQGWWDGVRGNMGPRRRQQSAPSSTVQGSASASLGPAKRPSRG